jgi:hypothetical protein
MPYIIDNITANTIDVKDTLLINGEEITPGLQTVSVDGVTIVGNGTTISPLTAVTSTTYKVYSAFLTQTGTTAPVATVLENTLGYDLTWEYTNVGVYTAVGVAGTFEDNKFAFIQGAGNGSSLVSLWGYNNSLDFSEMLLECYDLGNVSISFVTKNNILLNQFIEIRLYN